MQDAVDPNRVLKNYVNGKWVESKNKYTKDVINPATGEILTKVKMTSSDEIKEDIQSAYNAFTGWRKTVPLERARLLMKLKNLIEENQNSLAECITKEHGKTLKESLTEVERAIENIEVASGACSLIMGNVLEDVAYGIDEYAVKQPLGVFSVFPPFNFPAMVPFWFLPYAVAAGNTYIVKPSPLVPITMSKIFELIDKAGFPAGVINLINGDKETADVIMEDPLVKGISFVGSTEVGRYVYKKCTENFKRIQVQAGAKNFGIVMEDANFDKVVPNIIASAFDCSGQRCLALAVILAVGNAYEIIKQKVLEKAKKIKVGYGLERDVNMGPVISKKAKERIENYIFVGIKEGANLILDGRNCKIDKYPSGNWIGPTIFSECKKDMRIVNEEIFGPVLCIMQVKDLDEAFDIIHSNRYGNAATIYTQSGKSAREFKYNVGCGNLGVNIGVAAPMAFFRFSGTKDSFYGDIHVQGKDSFEFFTNTVVVVERWF